MGAHVTQHRGALDGVHEGHHPAQHVHHLVGRDRRHQRVVDRDQLGIGVARPQHRVVRRLLDVHVLEIVGDEQRQRAVQRQRGGRATRRFALQQRRGLLRQRDDGMHVLLVLVRDFAAGAGCAGLQRRVDEVVLVLQVRATEIEQLEHALRHLRALQRVLAVHPADGQQGVGHQRTQRLVDAGIHVDAGRCGLRDKAQFALIDVHGVLPSGFSGRRTMRPPAGKKSRNRSPRLPLRIA